MQARLTQRGLLTADAHCQGLAGEAARAGGASACRAAKQAGIGREGQWDVGRGQSSRHGQQARWSNTIKAHPPAAEPATPSAELTEV